MVRMGDVWDRTTEVLAGRGSILASIAGLTMVLPGVIRDAAVAYQPAGGIAAALLVGLLSLVAMIAMLWGQLALLAVAGDPTVTAADGYALATKRLLPAIALSIALILIVFALCLPMVGAVIAAGVDYRAMATTGTMPGLSRGLAGFVIVYALVVTLLFFWAAARLVLVNAVVVNERVSIGAIRRSIALTRGLTWRLIGVMLLFVVVVLVATTAAQMVSGIAFRLILGGDQAPTVAFLAAVAGAIVSAIFTVVAAVFSARLYAALTGGSRIAPPAMSGGNATTIE